MSDPMQHPNTALSEQAKELEKAQNFAKAAEIYMQMHINQPVDNYPASHYISCLRKLNRSAEAVEFGWTLSDEMRANTFVHNAWAWAIYDIYFKTSENKKDDEDEDEDTINAETSREDDKNFKKMQKATIYVLEKISPHEPKDMLLRKKFILGICREAKLRKKWEIVYQFATQLDPAQLAHEADQWSRMPEYEQWLYRVVKALLKLERYEECQKMAQQALETYSQNKYFHWWYAIATARIGHPEEALKELQNLDKRYQEWFMREDIAKICEQSQRYHDAWIWYCKAVSLQGPLKGRYKMIGGMSLPLQHLERWQEAYEHLQLAFLLAEREGWEKSKMAQSFKVQMEQLYNRFPDLIVPQEYTSRDFRPLQRKLQQLWKDETCSILPHRRGYIIKLDEEKRYGFIQSNTDSFHFSFRNIPRNLRPTIHMEVEFDVGIGFDKNHKESPEAINIRPV
jgi:tetratricopeptide (TPR) repeat protein